MYVSFQVCRQNLLIENLLFVKKDELDELQVFCKGYAKLVVLYNINVYQTLDVWWFSNLKSSKLYVQHLSNTVTVSRLATNFLFNLTLFCTLRFV